MDHRLPKALEQDQAQAAGDYLLVVRHQFKIARRRDRAPLTGKPARNISARTRSTSAATASPADGKARPPSSCRRQRPRRAAIRRNPCRSRSHGRRCDRDSAARGRPPLRFKFVGSHHLGLVGAGAFDRLRQQFPSRAINPSMLASSHSRKGRSRINPYLMTSAMPTTTRGPAVYATYRYPPEQASAARRRRSCSCRAGG
jgi:hypothetical protein